ncbi:hypothetical protein K9L27_04795 [Candidatus Gracilibacteria bacterium]|nr:hypothetical protein [Candidatus Gracilibacteria bacterium]
MSKYFSVIALFLFIPLCLALDTTVGYEISAIEITPLGSGTEIKTGETTEVGKFRVSNRSQNRKKIQIQAIRFKNYGTARPDQALENPFLSVGEKQVSVGINADSKYITFLLDNGVNGGFLLNAGDSVIFSIQATLAYARAGDTLQLGLQYEEDFIAQEVGTGFQVSVKQKPKLALYQLHSGDLSFIRNYYQNRKSTNTSPSQSTPRLSRYSYRASTKSATTISPQTIPVGKQSFAPGAKDVLFLNSFVRSKTGVRTEGLTIEVSTSSFVSDKNENGITNELEDFNETFSDFRLFVDGQMIDSTNEFDAGPVLVFNSSFDLFPNSNIQIVGRITQNAKNGDKLKLQLNPKRLHDPQYIE